MSLKYLLNAGPENISDRKAAVKELISHVASNLGNTPTVARKNYICPIILERFQDGSLDAWINRWSSSRGKREAVQRKILRLLKE